MLVSPWRKRTALLLVAGTVFFAGSLYVMALSNLRILGAITPLGGLCYIAAWVLLAKALPGEASKEQLR